MSPSSLKRAASPDRDISPPAKRKVAVTTTPEAIANFFKPTSEKVKDPDKVSIKVINDSVLAARYLPQHGCSTTTGQKSKLVKVAAFDFDDTIITTKSGNRFAHDAQDWQWWDAGRLGSTGKTNPPIPERLKRLYEDDYAIAIISNQAAISLKPSTKTLKTDMKSLDTFKGKVTAVLSRLDLPISLYAATKHDIHRKPRPGMWDLLLEDLSLDADHVDHEQSMFVGDAAGRGGNSTKGVRKDHSCSDRDFAANIGIPFYTPDEFFLGEAPIPFSRAFEPTSYAGTIVTTVAHTSLTGFTKNNDLDLVLFCGSPGAGKSTFFWKHMQPWHYKRVNQDSLKTRDRCMKVATKHLQDGEAVVVDNTNADVETRASWIALARRLKVPVRLVYFTAHAKLCEHNDTVRALTDRTMNPENRTMLPKIAFSSFTARFQPPTLKEGFQDIYEVDFEFDGPEAHKRLWTKYWIS